jgi:WhiB family transcriptional regulator, redox-sensing transcriptional regulator
VRTGARARLVRQAQCADTDLDADLWFPVNPHPVRARREAAEAIAICDACPVRAQCLAWSLEHWTLGQHGVWGGLVPADRAALRRSLRLAS